MMFDFDRMVKVHSQSAPPGFPYGRLFYVVRMDLSPVYKIICYALAAYNLSKDAHYHAKYNSFYGNHLLADRLSDKWDDYIDELKEVFYLGNEVNTPESKQILKDTIPLIPDITENTHDNNILLYKFFSDFHAQINTLRESYKMSYGEENLIGDIDQLVQNNKGLLWRATLG